MSTEPQSDTSTQTTKFQDHLLVAIGDLEQSGDHEHPIPHGLAISAEVEASDYGPSELHNSRLYDNLRTLKHRDLVEKTSIDERTTGYQLTERGRQHLAQTGSRLLAATPDSDGDAVVAGEANARRDA